MRKTKITIKLFISLMLFLLVAFCSTLCVDAAEGDVIATGELSSITFRIVELANGNYNMELTGSGDIPSYPSESNFPWYSYRAKIERITIGNGITSIGQRAFSSHSALKEVDLSNNTTLTSIGVNSFYYCTSLTTIDLSRCTSFTTVNDYAFYNCTGLTTVKLPTSITRIGELAFYKCSTLNDINLSDLTALNEIGVSAFNSCFGLTSVDLSRCTGLTAINDNTFNYCTGLTTIKLPNIITRIGNNVFNNCTALETVDFSNLTGLTDFGEGVFDSCANLQSIDLSNTGILGIGSYTFYYCTALEEVILPISVEYIGGSTFERCTNLSSINLEDLEDLEEIGSRAFYRCESLERVDLSNSNLLVINESAFAKCINLVEFKFPNSLTEIVNSAFLSCESLENVDLSECDSLYKIGGLSFRYNYSLKEVKLPSSIEIISNFAFYKCSELERINLENCTNLTRIGGNAFQKCSKLKDVTLNSEELVEFETYVFANCSSLERVDMSGCTGLTNVAEYTFEMCENLKEFILPATITKISSHAFARCTSLERADLSTYPITVIDLKAFAYDIELRELVLPESIEQIGEGAYYCCAKLNQVNFEECTNLKYIEMYAFKDCYELRQITLPESIVYIKYRGFYDCNLVNADLSRCINIKEFGEEVFNSLYENHNEEINIIFPRDVAFHAEEGLFYRFDDYGNDYLMSYEYDYYVDNDGIVWGYFGDGVFLARLPQGIKNYTVPETIDIKGVYDYRRANINEKEAEYGFTLEEYRYISNNAGVPSSTARMSQEIDLEGVNGYAEVGINYILRAGNGDYGRVYYYPVGEEDNIVEITNQTNVNTNYSNSFRLDGGKKYIFVYEFIKDDDNSNDYVSEGSTEGLYVDPIWCDVYHDEPVMIYDVPVEGLDSFSLAYDDELESIDFANMDKAYAPPFSFANSHNLRSVAGKTTVEEIASLFSTDWYTFTEKDFMGTQINNTYDLYVSVNRNQSFGYNSALGETELNEITVYLYCDGEKQEEVTLTFEDGEAYTYYTFEDLDMDKSYYVDVDHNVPEYGAKISYRYAGKENSEKVKIELGKQYAYTIYGEIAGSTVADLPEVIEVEVKRTDGELVGTAYLTEENDYSYVLFAPLYDHYFHVFPVEKYPDDVVITAKADGYYIDCTVDIIDPVNVTIFGNEFTNDDIHRNYYPGANLSLKIFEETSIDGEVIWKDYDNEDNTRPEEVTVRIYKDGVEDGSVVVTPDDNGKWLFEFDHLQKSNENGECVYTVSEDDLTNYEIEYSDEGYIITNTYLKGKVRVHHYLEGTQDELADDVIMKGPTGTTFETKPAEELLNNYDVIEPDVTTGEYEYGEQEFTYYYKLKDSRVVIHYREIGNEETPIREDETISAKYNETYQLSDYAYDIEGYKLSEDFQDEEIIVNADSIERTIYYDPTSKVVVHHMDKYRHTELGKDELEEAIGKTVTTYPKDFTGYVLVERPENETITVTKEVQDVYYYYSDGATGVVEKHIDNQSGDVLYEEFHEGEAGTPYDIKSKEFVQYVLDENKLPEKPSGVMVEDTLIEVKYYYNKETKVVVHYTYKEGTNEVEIEQEIILGYVTKDYSAEPKEYDDYIYESSSKNTSGKMTEDVIDVYFYYTKDTKVIVHYVELIKEDDVELEKEIETLEIKGTIGQEYTTEEKKYDGLEILKTKGDTKGTMTKEVLEVYYYYVKPAQVVVRYLDIATGEPIEDPEDIPGYIGKEYKTHGKDIEEYVLVEDTKNTEGEMGEKTTEVIYYYSPKAGVIVKYIDKDTGKEISAEESIDGYIGKDYKTNKKDIKEYEFVNATNNTAGKMKEKQTEVVYYYSKANAKAPETPKVENVTDKPSIMIVNNNIINNYSSDNGNPGQTIVIDGGSTTVQTARNSGSVASSTLDKYDDGEKEYPKEYKASVPNTGDLVIIIAISIIYLTTVINVIVYKKVRR